MEFTNQCAFKVINIYHQCKSVCANHWKSHLLRKFHAVIWFFLLVKNFVRNDILIQVIKMTQYIQINI